MCGQDLKLGIATIRVTQKRVTDRHIEKRPLLTTPLLDSCSVTCHVPDQLGLAPTKLLVCLSRRQHLPHSRFVARVKRPGRPGKCKSSDLPSSWALMATSAFWYGSPWPYDVYQREQRCDSQNSPIRPRCKERRNYHVCGGCLVVSVL